MSEDVAEEWRPCHGGLYEVSNLARVRRAAPGRYTWPGRIMKLRPCRAGYPTVSMKNGSAGCTAWVHRLVAEAFIGEPNGRQVNHKDGNKADSRLSNLEYVTPSENRRHAYRMGLQGRPAGSANSQAKLTESDVVEIRRQRATGRRLKDIAPEFGVSAAMLSDVCSRKHWKHVP